MTKHFKRRKIVSDNRFGLMLLLLVTCILNTQMLFANPVFKCQWSPPDSTEILKEQWKYCGDSYLMDLVCLDSIGHGMLTHPLIIQAKQFYGLRDIEGKEHEPQVIMFFHETGNTKIYNDEAAWCSVFMGYCAKQKGYQYSKYMNARSWLSVGDSTNHPEPGDIVVFWREKKESWKGHVSIYLGKSTSTNEIYCLGGNQNDEVCIQTYPAENVLGFRRIKPMELISGK